MHVEDMHYVDRNSQIIADPIPLSQSTDRSRTILGLNRNLYLLEVVLVVVQSRLQLGSVLRVYWAAGYSLEANAR